MLQTNQQNAGWSRETFLSDKDGTAAQDLSRNGQTPSHAVALFAAAADAPFAFSCESRMA